jgi:hypothetical protein
MDIIRELMRFVTMKSVGILEQISYNKSKARLMKQTFQLNLFTFPVWWYTVGFPLVLEWAKNNFRYGVKRSGFSLFVRYMNAPLYGDYTRSGRIISFLLRIVLLFAKIAGLGFRLLGLGIFLLGYLIILPLCAFLAIYSIIPF